MIRTVVKLLKKKVLFNLASPLQKNEALDWYCTSLIHTSYHVYTSPITEFSFSKILNMEILELHR